MLIWKTCCYKMFAILYETWEHLLNKIDFIFKYKLLFTQNTVFRFFQFLYKIYSHLSWMLKPWFATVFTFQAFILIVQFLFWTCPTAKLLYLPLRVKYGLSRIYHITSLYQILLSKFLSTILNKEGLILNTIF